MLKTLIETCRNLEKNWKREAFPEVARKTLEDFIVEPSLEDFEVQVANWLSSEEMLPQLNLYNNFGEPSLTLFNNGKFALDVYFWRKNDTLIHSHGFRGAFKILYGVSLHEEFEVETTETFSKDLLKTNLTQKDIRIMKQGDVQQINPDMELTHRVVHLDDPTVSLCLRTVEDTTLHQWHHLSSGLSFQKNHITEKTIKKCLYFQYLLGSDAVRAQKFYAELLSELNTSSKIALYEGLCFGQLGLYEATNEIAADFIYESFQKEKWFELYEKHYEGLQKNLQESQAQSPELKLLAHAINNNQAKEQTQKLLKELSDKKIEELCEELKTNTEVFTEGFELDQLDKIDQF